MTARTEHTPGPWTADSDGRIVSESALEWSGTLNMTRRAYVASTGGAAFDANARLIASAPALLAACEAQQLVSDLRDICQDETERLFAKVAALGISVPETATAANWKQTAYYLADCVSDTAMDMRHAAIAQARGEKS